MRTAATLLAMLALTLAACGEEKPEPEQAADLPYAVCYLRADGFFGMDFVGSQGPLKLAQGELGAEDPAEQTAALERMRQVLADALHKPPYLDEHRDCRLLFRLEGAWDAKWKYVQWILQTAADPSVRVHKIDLRLAKEEHGTRIDLPTGQEEREAVIKDEEIVEPEDLDPADGFFHGTIRLFRRDFWRGPAAHTRLKIGREAYDLAKGGRPGEAAYDASTRKAEQGMDALLKDLAPNATVHIAAPPPKGPHVPYGEALHVIRHIKQAGDYRITLEGSPPPVRRVR